MPTSKKPKGKVRKVEGWGLILKKLRYGDELVGDLVGIYLSRRIAKQNYFPRYQKMLPITVTYHEPKLLRDRK